ncbi:MAG: hypothetical protein ABL959_09580, partial [Pyrinomonadaceae bacterium]
PPNSNEEKTTMKLTKEQKLSLGIEFDGDDVPDDQILTAAEALAAKAATVPTNLAELTAQADAGKKYIELQRAEVTRLATLACLGAEEGELPKVFADDIEAASFERLVDLQDHYQGEVAKRFPNGRSSEEDSLAVDKASGVKAEAAALPRVSIH